MDDVKPTRCIDPVVKYCQGCPYSHVSFPSWVETAEDVAFASLETCCIYGFDKGRPEDNPTPQELAELEEWVNRRYDD